MAERPKNTRLSNVFNPGVDNRIPLGFVDYVIDKETGNLVGFVKDGQFYNLGDKVKKSTKPEKEPKASDLDKSITMVEDLLSKKEKEVLRFEPGTEEYVEITNAIKQDKVSLQALKTRFNTARATESDTEKKETFQSEENTFESKLALAKKKVQVAKDTNGDVAAAQAELDSVAATQPFTPVIGRENQSMAGQPSGYRNVATQTTGTTPTPVAGTPSKGGTPPKGGKGSGDTPPKVPALTDAEQRAQALETAAGEDFDLPETIFNNVDSLKLILKRYVKEDWTESKLRKAIRDDVWFRKNSKEIKARYVQLYNYEDLVKTGQINPQVPGNTQYEQDIASLERQIADKARAIGSNIASDPNQIKLVAKKMYLTNQGIDDPMTTDFIAAAIGPTGSMIGGEGKSGYSGQALKDYQEIQGIAKANGFRVKDIIPGAQTEQQVLQGIATGRIDANRLAQDARTLAAQGQPQYVRDLLGQGYNLDQVYAPYRQTMANLLEINADEIDLNDSTLRSAISDKGDMNIFDFKKTLKRDNRWQYTENAKQEVSDMTLKILRDFGFQG